MIIYLFTTVKYLHSTNNPPNITQEDLVEEKETKGIKYYKIT